MTGIFLRQGSSFVALREQRYEAETVLQELIAEHPEILAGDDAEHGNLLLIRREAGVSDIEDAGSRWSLDHLYLDATGIPTLVEVKRSSDTRGRREVVAQMLDYAANAATSWNVDQLAAWLEEGAKRRGCTGDDELRTAFGVDDPDTYWQMVHTNLAAERLRLIFVSDSIGPELRRIIEFLNGQMTDTTVLAIEVKQYIDEAGTQQTIVPRVVGQTQQARQAKSAGGRATPIAWDEGAILETAGRLGGPARRELVQQIIDWAHGQDHVELRFGRGSDERWGALRLVLADRPKVTPFGVWTSGGLEIGFEYMARSWPPFDEAAKRRELLERLNGIPGVDIADDRLEKRPNIQLDDVAEDFPQLLAIIGWAFSEARVAVST